MPRFRVPLADAIAGVTGQLRRFDETVAGFAPADFDRPTRLGGWRVAELVAHVGSSHLAQLLAGPSAGAADIDVVGWAAGCAPAAAAVDDRARAATDEARPAELRALVRETRLAVTAALGNLDETFVVPARFGAIALADYLATRCVELTVHTLDLGAALGVAADLEPAAARVATRALTHVLGTLLPGRSVEVRVPPYAAVQVGPGGPRHTRGTPGSVVETDPVTWLELATGRLTWAEARAAGRLHASGEHADLSAHLPVLA